MRWKYEPQWDILNVWMAEGKTSGSTRVPPDVIVDLADDGRVLALEILDVSEQIPFIRERPEGEVIARPEPLWPFRLQASIGEERERLIAYVKHIISVLNALTSPVVV